MGDITATVNKVAMRMALEMPKKTIVRQINYADVVSADTYTIFTLPARSICLACFMVVTTTWTGGTALEFGGVGTTDNDNLYMDATDGAIANLVARSIVGMGTPTDAPVVAADNEVPLMYDTAAQTIDIQSTGTMTAGEGYMVIQYQTFVGNIT